MTQLKIHTPVIRAVEAVVAVQKAERRIEEPQRPGVTYFSENDIWLFDTEATRSTGVGPCPTCLVAEVIEHFRGNNLRVNFPNLVILDENTIGGSEPDGGGLVHPHCRCFLNRVIGALVQV